ncbi:MAG: DUF2510 domain-containing protein [Candidatus Nanopelagicales bacterium]|jgi:hypothetical protein|nr:DUF2510 domain-containing protein [Candidatus Nanopelagicales bacterium]MCU0295105.1 DUF2510 domain-containing protein [Candidatus Nanopelagicales bacterium]MCU0298008.1 DUF2510 domain-containing protein [Candidatus Nanopelagicales bacterium]
MRKTLPIVLMIVGIVMFAVGIAFAVGGITSSVSSIANTTLIGSPFSTPGSSSTQLEPGTYVVYENIGFQGSRPGFVTVDPDSITVSGPGGDVVTTCVSCGASSSTLTLGSTTYVGVVSFQVTQAGEYTVASEDDTGAQLVLGPSLADAIGGIFGSLSGFFGWTGLAIVGALLGVAGLIWLIIAAVTGGSKPPPVAGIPYYDPAVGQQTQAYQAPVTPGSWYPDPEDPSQLRWWDGRQWTDQRRPRT